MLKRKQFGALLVLLGCSVAAQAQDRFGEKQPDPVFDATIAITAGLGYSWTDSTMRLDAADGTPGTALDGESDLGLDANGISGQLDVVLRPRPRHRVRLGFNQLPSDRSANHVATEDVFFGDNAYLAGDELHSVLRIRS